MSQGQLPFFERMLRVAHSHVAHRAIPPTRFEPWTDNRRDAAAYRQFIGYRCINTSTDETTFVYLVPDFDSPDPRVIVYFGPHGDPVHDEALFAFEVNWDA